MTRETWLELHLRELRLLRRRECPQCRGLMEERQCKLVCVLCGAMRSCDDP